MKRYSLMAMLLFTLQGLFAQTAEKMQRLRQDPQTWRLAAEADRRLVDLRVVTCSSLDTPPQPETRENPELRGRRSIKKADLRPAFPDSLNLWITAWGAAQ